MKPLQSDCLCTALDLCTMVVLSLCLVACGGGSSGGSSTKKAPITVSLHADPGPIQAGATAQITATVGNDPANGGVRWTVSCPTAPCGSVSPTTTASGVAATYSAPATSPPMDLAVNITATSVSDAAVAASTTVTVAGISLGLNLNPTVMAGTTSQISATVVNDAAHRGVTWSVSCATAPCGTISPSNSASDVPVTYTAPVAVPPEDLAVTVTASAMSAPSVQASDTITVPALAITVGPSGIQTAAGTTVQFTASVNYPPPADQGVTWIVTCGASDCGTLSPTTSASGTPVTYTAPAASPPADLKVTVTASSASAPAVRGTSDLTVSAVTVVVTPVSALIPLGITQQFIGHVGNDPTSSGIAWSLTQGGAPCDTACGSLSPSATANGGASTYTAPGVLPAKSAVTVTATSVADHTKTASATAELTAGSVKLVPADLSFIKIKGSEKRPPPQTATLTNVGNSALTIQGITIGGTNPDWFSQSNTCGSSLAPAASCAITVSVRIASSGTGSRLAVLTISDGSIDSPQQLQLSLTFATNVTAATRTALAAQTAVATPPPSGGDRVGSQVRYLADAARADPYVPDGTQRELPVRFWYPTTADGTCVPASYAPPQVWNYLSALVGVPPPQVSTHSCLNAPIAPGPHPVVVISHGFTGTFTDYTFLAEDLASRGYVVASVNHTHEATAVEFPDGRLEKSVFGSHLTQFVRSDAGALGYAVSVRLDDLRFVLKELERLNATDSQFASRLDLNHIALAGHSLGGLTTLRALSSEPRFKAGVLLDGLIPPHIDKSIYQPVLTLVAGHERWNEDDCMLWNALRGPRLAVNLAGAEHIALSDAAWLLKGSLQTGRAGPDAMIATIRGHVASFLDANLRGRVALSTLTSAALNVGDTVVANTSESLCAAR